MSLLEEILYCINKECEKISKQLEIANMLKLTELTFEGSKLPQIDINGKIENLETIRKILFEEE